MEAGDTNTKSFHATTNARYQVNRINVIATRGGVWEKREDIQSEIVCLYQNLYPSEYRLQPQMDGVFVRKLTSSRAFSLEDRFTKEEIKETVFGLGYDLALGLDGFQIIFY